MHNSFALLLTTSLPFAASGVPKDTRSYIAFTPPIPLARVEDEETATPIFPPADLELAA